MTMNKHKENPYKILGVTPEADEKDIKKAYRKMAMKYHPDKQTTQEEKTKANLMFSKISAAYQTVIDIDHLDGSKRSDWEGSSRTDHNNSSRSRSAPRSPVVSSHRRSVIRSHSPPPPTSPGLFSKARMSFGTPKRGDSPSKRDTSPHHRHHASGSPNRRSSLGSKPRPRPRPSGAGTHQFPRKNVSTGTNPRPRPQSPGRLSGHPKKHMSTGASVTRNSGSVSLTGNAPMGRPRRQSSTGALPKSRKFRDPFLIFDQVMNEEYGKDYKKKAAHEWNLDEKGKHLLTKSPKNKKKPSAKHAFKDIDSNGDDALSKGELRKFVESNSELWAVLGTNLGLGEKTCINIATQVAFSLAKGETDEKTSKKTNAQLVTDYELSEKEFKTFYKEYVLSQKGSYDFFLRTIFAVFDANGDGVLQKDEFENFLDVFYKAKNAYRMKLTEMPSKPNFMRIAEARLDKNKDGVLSYMEVRDLLAVAALVTTDKTTTKK